MQECKTGAFTGQRVGFLYNDFIRVREDTALHSETRKKMEARH